MQDDEWEITGRLGELQLEWLRQHYSHDALHNALQSVRNRGRRAYPLNVAKVLATWGGPRMPPPGELLRGDPLARAEERRIMKQELAKLRELRNELARRSWAQVESKTKPR